MRVCPSCNYEIENDTARFCKHCGIKLPEVISKECPNLDNNSVKNDDLQTDIEHEKKDSIDSPVEDKPLTLTSDWLKDNTTIHGWLSFFLFAMTLGGLISAIYPIVTYNSSDYADNFWLGAVDIITGLMMLSIASYTVFLFNKRKPNAVFYGRLYIIIVLLTNVLLLCSGATEGNGLQSTTQAVRGIIWAIIWFLYLLLSRQVKEIIPQKFRKVKPSDWGILLSVILVPIICFVIGFIQISSLSNDMLSNENILLNTSIADNERTDGRVIFKIPTEFSCVSNNIDIGDGLSLTIFTLSNDNIGNISICSSYDNDTSSSNFNSYWSNWEDEDAKGYPRSDVDSGSIDINGNLCRFKVINYLIDGITVYWRFYVIFDKDSYKCCLISAYDRNEDTAYIDNLLNAIRF